MKIKVFETLSTSVKGFYLKVKLRGFQDTNETHREVNRRRLCNGKPTQTTGYYCKVEGGVGFPLHVFGLIQVH